MSNSKLAEQFLTLARDLDVMEPKLPEDVYKMHLVDARAGPGGLPAMDSAMKNLSATLVNALLNVGFGADKLVTPTPEPGAKEWIFRNKEQGKLCATASLGVSHEGRGVTCRRARQSQHERPERTRSQLTAPRAGDQHVGG